MADLQDGHPGIVKIQQFRLNFFQYFQRQGRRARVKIEYPAHVDYSFSQNIINYCKSSSRCTTIPSRNLGSNQVDLGGMI